jgi:hypothetical protein
LLDFLIVIGGTSMLEAGISGARIVNRFRVSIKGQAQGMGSSKSDLRQQAAPMSLNSVAATDGKVLTATDKAIDHQGHSSGAEPGPRAAVRRAS